MITQCDYTMINYVQKIVSEHDIDVVKIYCVQFVISLYIIMYFLVILVTVAQLFGRVLAMNIKTSVSKTKLYVSKCTYVNMHTV